LSRWSCLTSHPICTGVLIAELRGRFRDRCNSAGHRAN